MAAAPREPRRGEPTLVCATFEKLRLWEFEPARRDGEPIAVLYNLRVRFDWR